jgi:hypothetical protein
VNSADRRNDVPVGTMDEASSVCSITDSEIAQIVYEITERLKLMTTGWCTQGRRLARVGSAATAYSRAPRHCIQRLKHRLLTFDFIQQRSRKFHTISHTTFLTGRPAAWRACGLSGATVRDALQRLVPRVAPEPADLLIVAFGVNFDTTGAVQVERYSISPGFIASRAMLSISSIGFGIVGMADRRHASSSRFIRRVSVRPNA